MSQGTPLSEWIRQRRREREGRSDSGKEEVINIIQEIGKHLETSHGNGNYCGNLSPETVMIHDDHRQVKSLPKCVDEQEAGPHNSDCAHENANKTLLMQEKDFFDYGCLIYFLFSNGQHPFGAIGSRQHLIEHNLYNVNACVDQSLRELIFTVIQPDRQSRPTISQLRDLHPLFWTDDEVEKYINNSVNEPSGSVRELFKGIFVYPDHRNIAIDARKYRTCTVAEILETLKVLDGKHTS